MVPTGPVSFGVDMQQYFFDQYGQPVDKYGRRVRVVEPAPAPRFMPRVPYNYQPQQYPNQQAPQARQQPSPPPEQPWTELLKSNQKLQHLLEKQTKVLHGLENKIDHLQSSDNLQGQTVHASPIGADRLTDSQKYIKPYNTRRSQYIGPYNTHRSDNSQGDTVHTSPIRTDSLEESQKWEEFREMVNEVATNHSLKHIK